MPSISYAIACAEELKKLMIHIETVEYYDLYMNLRVVYNETMREKMGDTVIIPLPADSVLTKK